METTSTWVRLGPLAVAMLIIAASWILVVGVR
jgi:hypothetical protein